MNSGVTLGLSLAIGTVIGGPVGTVAGGAIAGYLSIYTGRLIDTVYDKAPEVLDETIKALNSTIFNIDNANKLTITTPLKNVNDIKTLASPFVLKGSVVQDVTINNMQILNQNNNTYLKDISNAKSPLQSIISNVSDITKKIVQPITNNLSTLIKSGIANISDISIGKTTVGNSIVYFGNQISNIVSGGLNTVTKAFCI